MTILTPTQRDVLRVVSGRQEGSVEKLGPSWVMVSGLERVMVPKSVAGLIAQGLVVTDEGGLRVTPKGMGALA